MTDAWQTPERVALRTLAHEFTERDVLPNLADWEDAGDVPRWVHEKAAAAGLLGVAFPEDVGGGGGNSVDAAIVTEEIIGTGGSGGLCAALFTHGIALPHMVAEGDPYKVERFVRPTLEGQAIGALAITEPDGGSDVANLRTHAELDGEDYVVNGAKTFITSGARADFVTTAVRTGESGWHGISLIVVPTDAPGFSVTRRLQKMGWQCSDTAELSYADCRVPARNLIGAPGDGFIQIARQFVSERIALAVQAYAIAARCVELSLRWSRERQTFGHRLADHQVVRHKLVDMIRRTDVARTYVRSVIERYVAGEDVIAEAAMAKNTAVEACEQVAYDAVQLHGGAGYMRDTEVERHYRDARILAIGGGATEIMNDLVARRMGI